MPLIELALQCDTQVVEDWKTYCDAYDRGAFRDPGAPAAQGQPVKT